MCKNIAVFLDGTWDVPDVEIADGDESTNVYRLYVAASRISSNNCIYISGIGTSWVSREFGGWFGLGLMEKVIRAVSYISGLYVPGDRVYIVGFSRGAYTARLVAGMLDHVGVLPNASYSDLESAWFQYRDGRTAKKSHPMDITMLGLFDSVKTLGAPLPILSGLNRKLYGFKDSLPAKCVKYAYQALSIDETRASFSQNMWSGCHAGQEMLQQWFAGCHSDVGGGLMTSDVSDIALVEMAKQLSERGLELASDSLPLVSSYNYRAALTDYYPLFFYGAYKWFFNRKPRSIVIGGSYNAELHPSVKYRSDLTGYKVGGLV